MLDNDSKDVVQLEGEQEIPDMTWVVVHAFGIDQTYVVKEGCIPASHFTMSHTHAETLDGGVVRLVRDPSRSSYRVFASR